MSRRTFKCAMCGEDTAWGALIAHIPQCYRQYCANLGMVPLCTCHTCEGRRTHPNADLDSRAPSSTSSRSGTGRVRHDGLSGSPFRFLTALVLHYIIFRSACWPRRTTRVQTRRKALAQASGPARTQKKKRRMMKKRKQQAPTTLLQ